MRSEVERVRADVEHMNLPPRTPDSALVDSGDDPTYCTTCGDLRALLALVEAVRAAETPLAKAAAYLSGAEVYCAQLDAIDAALAALAREGE